MKCELINSYLLGGGPNNALIEPIIGNVLSVQVNTASDLIIITILCPAKTPVKNTFGFGYKWQEERIATMLKSDITQLEYNELKKWVELQAHIKIESFEESFTINLNQ